MNGICYTTRATDADVFKREAEELVLPLSNPEDQITSKNNIGIYNYGMGQIGFSLHVNSLGDDVKVTLGAPGVYNWKGDAILITTSVDGSFSRTIIPSLAREQQVHSYNYFGKNVFLLSSFFLPSFQASNDRIRLADQEFIILLINLLFILF